MTWGLRTPAAHSWRGNLWGGFFLLAIVLYGFSSGVRSEVVILLYVYALLGMGLYLPLVMTDQVSLAYAAYFGVGGYTYAVCSARGLGDPVLGIILGMALSGLLAFFVALATRRLSGYFLAVSTMLVALVFERFLIQATRLTGGPTGLGFPTELLGVTITRNQLLIGGAIVVLLLAIILTNLRRSNCGKGLLLMAHSWAAAESIGIETQRARIISVSLGASIASLAGSLFALSSGFVIPESFGLGISFLILFIPIIGGASSPWGCLIGAAAVCFVLQVAHEFGPSHLLFGLTVLAFVLFAPGGVLGLFGKLMRRFFSVDHEHGNLEVPELEKPDEIGHNDGPAHQDLATESPSGRRLLAVDGISKSFGGLIALHQVNFEVTEGEILGIVGPNGAGKSTLIDIVTGIQPADSGQVFLYHSLLSQGPALRACHGISRTFQHPLLAQELTILENVRLGNLRNNAPHTWHGIYFWFLRNMFFKEKVDATHKRRKSRMLAGCDASMVERSFVMLDGSWHKEVSDVSYGTEKLTESIRSLVSSPVLLIVDEPFAGLDHSSIEELGKILRFWKSKGLGAVIVDHNIDVLKNMCDRMVVLNFGNVIADGEPQEVLRNPEVRKAYFGEEA